VDIGKVFKESDYVKKQNDNLHTMGAARQGIIDLVRQYPVMKPEDATSFKDLTLKEKPTLDDKAALDRITQSAKEADTQYRALTTKASPTPTELAALEDYNRHKDQNANLVKNWGQEFENDFSSLQDKLRTDALQKVRDSVSQVAKDQGFSVVFVTDVAPYSANDITDAALKVMNKK
jgi:Skp family chaperone for outer membrane proteins